MNSLFDKLLTMDTRSKEAVKNIGMTVGAKSIGIVSSLLVVPMTINYINPTQYGIWITLSSIIGWIAFFDLGLGNGFRNRFAQAKAEGNLLLARQYLSTTYVAISSIVIFVFITATIGNSFVSWSEILGIDSVYDAELSKIFIILCCFFCINMIANIFGSLLNADQKPGYNSLIQCAGQLVSILVIFILTKTTDGSLTNLATYFAGVPCTVMLISSIVAFKWTRYKEYRPSFSYVRINLIKKILNLGVQFFVIYLCLIAIFQVINIVISREFGPEYVTKYDLAQRYFNVLYMVVNIVLTPIWSAFTDAYAKRDILWMKKVMRTLECLWLLEIIAALLMVLLSPFAYKIWVGGAVDVPFGLSLSVMLLVICQSFGTIYMSMINGIGVIRLQLIVYVSFALIIWPILLFSCKMGIEYVALGPALVYIVQGIVGRIQMKKILGGTAHGLWNK
jgi:O-antigen/teichoic acid export membrane protein